MSFVPNPSPAPNLVLPKLAHKPWYRRVWVWIIGVFLLAWFGLPLVLRPFIRQVEVTAGTNQLTKLSGSEPQPASTVYDVLSPTSPGLGPVTAPVIVVEFGDFQCPFCREAEPILKQVLSKYPEAVRLVFRNLPLQDVHPEALPAAEAAACAAAQGKFWPYHDGLYANQATLGDSLYTSLATSLGLDLDQFAVCRQNHLSLSAIQADFSAAVAAGAQGTPTWFVNGHRIAGVLPAALWDTLITAALREKFTQ